jgi:hypothetical protein
VKSPRLLQPLPVPEGAWQITTMDFIEGLPQSAHANCILVIVDKFTKYSVAKMFMDNIYRLHGLPLSIVSKRDGVFTNKLWKEVFSLANV